MTSYPTLLAVCNGEPALAEKYEGELKAENIAAFLVRTKVRAKGSGCMSHTCVPTERAVSCVCVGRSTTAACHAAPPRGTRHADAASTTLRAHCGSVCVRRTRAGISGRSPPSARVSKHIEGLWVPYLRSSSL